MKKLTYALALGALTASATVPPMAQPAIWPTARASVATDVMTNIRKKVSTSSMTKAWAAVPVGWVAPSRATGPSRCASNTLASVAAAT